jgi:hypothetical protein
MASILLGTIPPWYQQANQTVYQAQMIHKLVWYLLDTVKDAQFLHIDAPEYTKAAMETFIIKSFGDKVKIVGKVEGYKDKDSIVILKNITDDFDLDSFIADTKVKLADSQSKKPIFLFHGLLKAASKATIQASIIKACVH